MPPSTPPSKIKRSSSFNSGLPELKSYSSFPHSQFPPTLTPASHGSTSTRARTYSSLTSLSSLPSSPPTPTSPSLTPHPYFKAHPTCFPSNHQKPLPFWKRKPQTQTQTQEQTQSPLQSKQALQEDEKEKEKEEIYTTLTPSYPTLSTPQPLTSSDMRAKSFIIIRKKLYEHRILIVGGQLDEPSSKEQDEARRRANRSLYRFVIPRCWGEVKNERVWTTEDLLARVYESRCVGAEKEREERKRLGM